jgi:hypothetical protein
VKGLWGVLSECTVGVVLAKGRWGWGLGLIAAAIRHVCMVRFCYVVECGYEGNGSPLIL